ncbi:MAG: hypothetical protein A2161_17855 [Candidatus Schekmanbacteria bacterium RBG_13_48_7]|uniref:DUF2769 domain-containing protein n=1 Tax=Candidatus Schekmanbacteria bacterium RBG_13_48_7 TaxID=1817878 RepID=A0A1F7RUX7_9BACT|nr:MAG: hypothetical protein A2161_17855 [Candidatus Schekmanbacteria bacterium RBG_13_48_7]
MCRVDDNKWNLEKCLKFCTKCPSFGNRKNEGLYCARGESKHFSEIQKRGCHCPECDIYKAYELTGSYFCINGAVV